MLQQLQLVSPKQMEEVARQVAPQAADPRAAVKELLRRGWLTPFQGNQLLQGRAQDLVLGPYLLLERLGEGGAGQVFKARHQKMDRVVALKVIRKELLSDAEAVARFYREIEVVSRLDHPHVVHAYDAGPVGANHFLAMEYVEGTDLGRLIKKEGRLPVVQACEYIRQAALGFRKLGPNPAVMGGNHGEADPQVAGAHGQCELRGLCCGRPDACLRLLG